MLGLCDEHNNIILKHYKSLKIATLHNFCDDDGCFSDMHFAITAQVFEPVLRVPEAWTLA